MKNLARVSSVIVPSSSFYGRSSKIANAALRPGAPVMQPPGWVLLPHM
jgi:hypothetical protein